MTYLKSRNENEYPDVRNDELLQVAPGAPSSLIYPKPKPLDYLSDKEWECLMSLPGPMIVNLLYRNRSPMQKQLLWPIDRAPKYPIPQRPAEQPWGRIPKHTTDPILALPGCKTIPDIPIDARYPFSVMEVGDSFVAQAKANGAVCAARKRFYPKDWVAVGIHPSWVRIWRTQ